MSKATDDVVAERERQIGAKGFTPDHDSSHDERELARAAGCYLDHYIERQWVFEHKPDNYTSEEMPDNWPWDSDYWKPKAPRRDLVRAAALIIAEIERLDRAAAMQRGG